MRRTGCERSGWIAAALLIAILCASCGAAAPTRAPAETFNYDRFGSVSLYRGRGHPHDLALLLSGDAGWDAASGALAQRLADQGTWVAGIDLRHYREALDRAAEACVSPASDLENLSHYLQAKMQFKTYLVPALVGEGSGAALAQATLAEAPEGLFKGAVGIGAASALDLKKALCGNAAATLLPGKWIMLDNDATAASAAAAAMAIDAAITRLAVAPALVKPAALPAGLADLPLILVPARAATLPRPPDGWFGVFLTGDGGWVGLDKGVSAELARHDIPIVGWDSLKYFWKRRTPEGASRDLDRVLRYYSKAWGRTHVLLIGYSQGADTLPFMVNRLPAATRRLVGFTTLLGISDNALWEFHVATWLGNPPKGIPTAPELARWTGSPYLCIYGESDADAACAEETGPNGTALKLAGGHHFGGGYDRIAEAILSRLPPVGSEAAMPVTPASR